MKEKADNLDRLVDLMKNKIKISNRRQKIQILTIAPASLSIEKTTYKTEFNVSAYMLRQARKLANEKGILELAEPKKGKVLSEETSRCVIDFYCDDEYSRLMPGKKDFVRIAKNTHMQKRLLLCDMKETLHVCFISTVSTLPGTPSFHQFVPLSETVMATKRVLEDKSYALEYNLVLGKKNTIKFQSDPKVSDFVFCSYDEKYWIGLIDLVDKEHEDVRVKFMHPSYPARSFSWPKKDDVCFVPIVNVACIIGAPVTGTGRQYTLDDKDIDSSTQLNKHSL